MLTVYGGRDERQSEKEDRYQSRQPPYPQVLASFESGNLYFNPPKKYKNFINYLKMLDKSVTIIHSKRHPYKSRC
jgi:hypothetical protein